MDKYLRVADGNYQVVVKSGGRITLDTGTEVGDVYITGNLTVIGKQRQILPFSTAEMPLGVAKLPLL